MRKVTYPEVGIIEEVVFTVPKKKTLKTCLFSNIYLTYPHCFTVGTQRNIKDNNGYTHARSIKKRTVFEPYLESRKSFLQFLAFLLLYFQSS